MIDNKQDAVDQIKNFFADGEELHEMIKSDSMHDVIHEIADSNCDVYNYDLLEWAKNNYHNIEDAISEFGHAEDSKGKPDFIKQIMQGQYLTNLELLNQALEELRAI